MIELRWFVRRMVEVESPMRDAGKPVIIRTEDVTVLQYRTSGTPISVWEETIPVWSDWKDVPTVTEGSEELV